MANDTESRQYQDVHLGVTEKTRKDVGRAQDHLPLLDQRK